MTIFGNYFYAQAIDEQATSYASQMLSQVQTNIDASVRAVDQVIAYLPRTRTCWTFLRVRSFYEPGRVDIETARA